MLILFSLLLYNSSQAATEISFGPAYSSYILYQDETTGRSKYNLGAEIGVEGIIPHIGLKIRGTKLRYNGKSAENPYDLEFIPITLSTSFNILPFINTTRFRLSLETGLGLFLWKGLYDDQTVILPTGEEMEEKDIGFVGGLTFQFKICRYIGLEILTRYNYIASANIYKYGFQDKDEKIWENGLGLNFILPLSRRSR